MKVVRLSALSNGPLYPQEEFLVFNSVRGWVGPRATMRPEWLSHWKTPVNPSGIEPATFRFVVQYLNQLRHRVPLDHNVPSIIWVFSASWFTLINNYGSFIRLSLITYKTVRKRRICVGLNYCFVLHLLISSEVFFAVKNILRVATEKLAKMHVRIYLRVKGQL
jgi:hypothetical protein